MYPRESGETFFGDIAGRLILVFSEATGTANAEGHQLNVIEMEDSSSGRGEHRTYAHGMGGVCLYVHVANFAAQRSPQVIKESTFGGTVLGAARTVVAGIEALRTTELTDVFHDPGKILQLFGGIYSIGILFRVPPPDPSVVKPSDDGAVPFFAHIQR